jgi:hypothetical protein
MAAPLLFYHIEIDIMYQPSETGNSQMSFLLSNERVRSYVRELTLNRYYSCPVFGEWANDSVRLLGQLPHLKHIKFVKH